MSDKKDEVRTCEENIFNALRKNPLVQLLVRALNDSGCHVIPHRHLVCEPCAPNGSVYGGYDRAMNQVMICSNICTSPAKVEQILIHELIHMFDFCRSNIDFDDVDHLACTEIRAANMAHCHLGDRPNGRLHLTHRGCVKRRASNSVRVIKGVTDDEAARIVERNFEKCYNDLEPIGRRYSNFAAGCLAFNEYIHFVRKSGTNQ